MLLRVSSGIKAACEGLARGICSEERDPIDGTDRRSPVLEEQDDHQQSGQDDDQNDDKPAGGRACEDGCQRVSRRRSPARSSDPGGRGVKVEGVVWTKENLL